MKKIKNLTKNFPNYPSYVGRKMMLRYINNDYHDYDIIDYIERTQLRIGSDINMDYEEAKDILDYWKYVFMMAKKKKSEAMKYLKESYQNHGPDAMAQYAYFYYIGKEITKTRNFTKAQTLFEQAMEKKSMFVEYLYAEALTYSNETEEAASSAIPYYEIALKKGVLFARYKLALCYIKTNQKLDKAVELLEKCNTKEANEVLKTIKPNPANVQKRR